MAKYAERYERFVRGVRIRDEGSVRKQREFRFLEPAREVLSRAGILEQDAERPEMSRNDAINALRTALVPYFREQEDLIYTINVFFEDAGSPWCDGNGRVLTIDQVNTPAEIRLKLLRYLQGGELEAYDRRRDEIAAHFNTSANTMDKYLRELKTEGCFLMGAEIPPIGLRYGRNSYDHTVHPVLLPLNLTDVYFLTAVLPSRYKDTPYEETAYRIGQQVYSSLSDYARKAMAAHWKARSLHYSDEPARYEQEDSTSYILLEKSGAPCRVWLNGRDAPLTGNFTLFGDGNFRLSDGTFTSIDRNDITFIERI